MCINYLALKTLFLQERYKVLPNYHTLINFFSNGSCRLLFSSALDIVSWSLSHDHRLLTILILRLWNPNPFLWLVLSSTSFVRGLKLWSGLYAQVTQFWVQKSTHWGGLSRVPGSFFALNTALIPNVLALIGKPLRPGNVIDGVVAGSTSKTVEGCCAAAVRKIRKCLPQVVACFLRWVFLVQSISLNSHRLVQKAPLRIEERSLEMGGTSWVLFKSLVQQAITIRPFSQQLQCDDPDQLLFSYICAHTTLSFNLPSCISLQKHRYIIIIACSFPLPFSSPPLPLPPKSLAAKSSMTLLIPAPLAAHDVETAEILTI